MSIIDKYSRLIKLSELVIKLHKLKTGRGYLTIDEKNLLRNSERSIDTMTREHQSTQTTQISIL